MLGFLVLHQFCRSVLQNQSVLLQGGGGGGGAVNIKERMLSVRNQLLRTSCEAFWPLHVLNIRVMEKEDKTAVSAHTFIFLAYLC